MPADTVMTNAQLASIFIVVSAMVAGQLLFKLSSEHIVVGQGVPRFLLSLVTWQFLLAMVFYSVSTLLWVLLLKHVPLSRAYPFMALSFVILPLAAYLIFKEPVSMRYVVGLIFFMTGLFLVAGS